MEPIQFQSHAIHFRLKDTLRIKTWLERIILAHHKFPSQIQFIFCADEYLLGINQSYLNHTTLTDIITFNYNAGHYVSGDIFISIDRVKENANTYKSTFDDELHRVMVHGILHLLGYNDKTPAEIKTIRKKEEESLKILAQV